MITHLMHLVREQAKIIKSQSGIIDELFALLCKYMTDEDIKSIEPLLTSMKNITERS